MTTATKLIFVFLFSVTSLLAQNNKDYATYYGKNLNAMIKSQISPSSARFRSIGVVGSEVLRNEIFRVLTLNHIEKADQGYDAIVEQCNANPQAKLNCYQQSKNEYSYSRGIVYNDLDKLPANNQTRSDYVVDVYCKQIYKFAGNSSSTGGFQNSRTGSSAPQQLPQGLALQDVQPLGDINIEHTWPQSKFSKLFPAELQKGDLHHLFPSNAKANSIRGNNPFGEVEREDSPVANCPSHFGYDHNGDKVYEPVDSHKGNVARALFYFSIRYKIEIDPDQEAVLRKWNANDPVDDVERERNNKIFKIQKNRNPFIDYPELSLMINNF